MKGKNLALIAFFTLALSLAIGFTLGKLICPIPDPVPLSWVYQGDVTAVSREGDDWLLSFTEHVTQSEKTIRISDKSRNLGGRSLNELVPGDAVQLLAEFYEYSPEVICVNYAIKEIP